MTVQYTATATTLDELRSLVEMTAAWPGEAAIKGTIRIGGAIKSLTVTYENAGRPPLLDADA